MFGLATGLYQTYFAAPQLQILIVGESGAGKTALLERLKVTHFGAGGERGGGSSAARSRGAASETEHREPLPARAFGVRPPGSSDPDADPVHPSTPLTAPRPPPRAVPGRLKLQATPPASRRPLQPQLPTQPQSQLQPPHHHPRKSSWVCPSPSKYRQAVSDDDADDDDVDQAESQVEDPARGSASAASVPVLPDLTSAAPSSRTSARHLRASVASLESVDLDDNADNGGGGAGLRPVRDDEPASDEEEDNDDEEGEGDPVVDAVSTDSSGASRDVQYDLLKGRTMLPLSKIRPTMGMNLAAIDALGATCRFQDLSGKFQRVWQSYYGDCDAVIFVFRIDSPSPHHQRQAERKGLDRSSRHGGGGNDDDDDGDAEERRRRAEKLSPRAQLALLAQVRGAVADDVPLLVLGHLWDEQGTGKGATPPAAGARTDTLYSSAVLLPHYHNPLQGVFFARATNGQGVRAALEWLIPLAKRQQRARQQQHLHR